MKSIFLIICLFYSSLSFSQKKINENTKVLNYVESVIGQHVTFVSWYMEIDTVKITQIRIWDFSKKEYKDYDREEIKKKFPNLFLGFTFKTHSPFSSSYRGNIDHFNFINTIYFFYGPDTINGRPHFRI